MAKRRRVAKRALTTPAPPVEPIFRRIQAILDQARAQVARSVNTQMVRAYWLIGRELVEEEQRGRARAGYGEELIVHLAARLKDEFGRGYTPTNLRYMRLFYLTYPHLLDHEIHHASRDKSGNVASASAYTSPVPATASAGALNPNLSWTHYRLLTKVESPHARSFYEIEAVRNHWSSRALELLLEFGNLLAEQDGFQALVVIQDVDRHTQAVQLFGQIAAQVEAVDAVERGEQVAVPQEQRLRRLVASKGGQRPRRFDDEHLRPPCRQGNSVTTHVGKECKPLAHHNLSVATYWSHGSFSASGLTGDTQRCRDDGQMGGVFVLSDNTTAPRARLERAVRAAEPLF